MQIIIIFVYISIYFTYHFLKYLERKLLLSVYDKK